jgi:hypothetical protein
LSIGGAVSAIRLACASILDDPAGSQRMTVFDTIYADP